MAVDQSGKTPGIGHCGAPLNHADFRQVWSGCRQKAILKCKNISWQGTSCYSGERDRGLFRADLKTLWQSVFRSVAQKPQGVGQGVFRRQMDSGIWPRLPGVGAESRLPVGRQARPNSIEIKFSKTLDRLTPAARRTSWPKAPQWPRRSASGRAACLPCVRQDRRLSGQDRRKPLSGTCRRPACNGDTRTPG